MSYSYTYAYDTVPVAPTVYSVDAYRVVCIARRLGAVSRPSFRGGSSSVNDRINVCEHLLPARGVDTDLHPWIVKIVIHLMFEIPMHRTVLA